MFDTSSSYCSLGISFGSIKLYQKDIISQSSFKVKSYIAKVVLSSNDDFKKILDSSKKSQIEWAKTTPLKRSRILSNYKNLIEL